MNAFFKSNHNTYPLDGICVPQHIFVILFNEVSLVYCSSFKHSHSVWSRKPDYRRVIFIFTSILCPSLLQKKNLFKKHILIVPTVYTINITSRKHLIVHP